VPTGYSISTANTASNTDKSNSNLFGAENGTHRIGQASD